MVVDAWSTHRSVKGTGDYHGLGVGTILAEEEKEGDNLKKKTLIPNLESEKFVLKTTITKKELGSKGSWWHLHAVQKKVEERVNSKGEERHTSAYGRKPPETLDHGGPFL